MQTADLVRMANQIARYYAGYPQAEAAEGTRSHLERFWSPAMRRQLAADVAAGRADALLPLARAAVQALAASAPAAVTGAAPVPASGGTDATGRRA
jgi:formate dehydrogenase subunit delta